MRTIPLVFCVCFFLVAIAFRVGKGFLSKGSIISRLEAGLRDRNSLSQENRIKPGKE